MIHFSISILPSRTTVYKHIFLVSILTEVFHSIMEMIAAVLQNLKPTNRHLDKNQAFSREYIIL